MLFRKFFLVAVLFGALVSCSKNTGETRDLSLYVSSFMKDNKEVVFFGHTNIKQVLDKAGYTEHELIKAVVDFNLGTLQNSIDVETPVYFVGEGPLKDDGTPKKLHLFVKVKSKDSLVGRLSDTWSYDVNESGEIAYTEDGDFVLGVEKDLAIITITGDDYDAATVVKNNFSRVYGDPIGGKDDDILKENGDFVVGVKLENLYGTSNTDLAKLDKQTMDDITAMTKDSYIMTKFLFENGAATIESKNMFSQRLKDELFFRTDPSSTMYQKLNQGEGTMLAAFAVNLDLDKMENFSKKYSPEIMSSINSIFGIEHGGLMSLVGSEHILSKLGDGQFGIAVYGDQMENSINVNSFWGATDTGKQLFKFYSPNIPMNLEYEYKEEGVYGRGSLMMEGELSKSRIQLPKGCEVFGKKGVTAFVNFHDIDMEMFEYEGELKLLEIVDYATFEYDADGGKLYIKAKNGQDNILKQSLRIVVGQLSATLNKIAV